MKIEINGYLHIIVERINGKKYFHSTANNLEEAQIHAKKFNEWEKENGGKSTFEIEIYYNQTKINEIFIDKVKKNMIK